MRVYVTTRFKGAKANKSEIEELCSAVRSAGMVDYNFIRDASNYEHTFDDAKELYDVARQKLEECDALLIDASDSPSGGRIVEVGMAFALRKPIFVIAKKGTPLKEFYAGIASLIIEYENIRDIIDPLRQYISDQEAIVP
jgi:nucleoside 2-deoxyribosyltransferase